jgi:phosphatidylglycerophosphate synthase/putative flippase GtrA
VNTFLSLLEGKLSTAYRIWTAAAPALAIVAYVLVGLLVYAIRNSVRGNFHDEEMDTRGVGGLTGARARHFFAWLMRPFWKTVVAAEIPPNAITTLSAGLAFSAGIAVAAGRFALGGWLYVTAGALDFLDGRVARVAGRTSLSGAALDSIVDRYCESAVLVGLAWYYRQSWVLFACLLALTGSLLVPYVRARGEALGATMKDVGFMQRPERIVVLGATVALSPILEALLVPYDLHPPHRIAIVGIALVAVTSHVTTIQRALHLLRSLGGGWGSDRQDARTLPRSVAVSFLATASDFATVWALVAAGRADAPLATTIGCAIGGVIAFTLSRNWAFASESTARGREAMRFAFVSGSSALLNAGGVAVVLLLPRVDYRIAWAVARGVIFVTWNYPLMRDYVFAPPVNHPPVEPAQSKLGELNATRV